MDPISLILAALAAGASAALKDTASDAIKSSYSKLKTLVRSRFGGDPAAGVALEHVEREPSADSTMVRQRLEAAGADRDMELVRQARELLERVDPQGAKAGKYKVKVTGGKGVVVGDNASVTMNFDD